MLFKSVIGQEEVRDQLIHAARENRVSHALLFHGPPGSGKFALALAFAQYLNCSNPGLEDSCGVCPSCKKAESFIHPDIHFVFPVVTGSKPRPEPESDLHIDKWRLYLEAKPYPELQTWLSFIKAENKQAQIFKKEAKTILRKLHLKAFESDYKIVLVWLPEKMNHTAANKLLKIIEEPPDKTIFLMVAQSTEEILPTILSRCQLLKVNKIPDGALAAGLNERFPEHDKVIKGIIRQADGDYLSAINLIESDEQNKIYLEHFILWMRLAYGFKVLELLEWVPKMISMGREKQKEFFIFCLRMIRGNFHINREVKSIVRLNPEEQQFAERFHKYIHPGNIEDLHNLLAEAIRHISMNANPKILFIDLSTSIYRLLHKQPLR